MHEEDHIQQQPTLRLTTLPNDANQKGDIFGGWLMSKIDIAAAIEARLRAKGEVATVAVKELKFIQPLFVYDLVSFYTKLESVGKTSLTIKIDVYARRFDGGEYNTVRVSEAVLVFCAISEPGVKRLVPPE